MNTFTYASLVVGLPLAAFSQNTITSSDFFNPDFKVSRPGTGGLISLAVDNSVYTGAAAQTASNVTWKQNVGGLAEVGVNLGVATANVRLAAYSKTEGDTLVFGREIVATTTGINLGNTVTNLTNQLVGASLLYSWDSTSTVSGLNLVAGQTYQLSFYATSASGLPVNLFTGSGAYMSFGVGSTTSLAQSNTAVNLLDLVTIGSGNATLITYQFTPVTNMSSLSFDFRAQSVAGVSALGGSAANQNVLTISDFSFAPVPEPAMPSLLGATGLAFIFRRRRNSFLP